MALEVGLQAALVHEISDDDTATAMGSGDVDVLATPRLIALADARLATVADADDVAHLLHDFNTEFDTPSPGVVAISARLRDLLATESTFADHSRPSPENTWNSSPSRSRITAPSLRDCSASRRSGPGPMCPGT